MKDHSPKNPLRVRHRSMLESQRTLETLSALLDADPTADRITMDRADLEAAALIVSGSIKETQSVWRCALSDVVGSLDVLRTRWNASRRKAEREAGARLGPVLDAVYSARNPAPVDYREAEKAGIALIERVRSIVDDTDGTRSSPPEAGDAPR